jgi:hypothetical protein
VSPERQTVLLLGQSTDPVLARLQQGLLAADLDAPLIPNLALAGVTVGDGSDGEASHLQLDGRTLLASGLRGIVVAQMVAQPLVPLDAEDRSYASAEIFATWLMLLAIAPCPVVNRPGEHSNYSWESPLHLRALARSLGLPVIDEVIASTRSLARRTDLKVGQACLDIANVASFWWSGAAMLQPGYLYSVTDHGQDDPFVVTSRAGGECLSVDLAPDGSTRPSAAKVAAASSAITLRLLDELNLDYGFCVHSLAGGEVRFSRLLTTAPAFLPVDMVEWSAARLQRLVLAADGHHG